MHQLAINGGEKIRAKAWPQWPIVGASELEQMTATIKSGIWGYNGPQERKFAREFAEYIGTQYAIPVANGTVSLQIALEALGIGFGDEVIVPGLDLAGDGLGMSGRECDSDFSRCGTGELVH